MDVDNVRIKPVRLDILQYLQVLLHEIDFNVYKTGQIPQLLDLIFLYRAGSGTDILGCLLTRS